MSVTEELRKSEKLLRLLLRENVRLDIQLTDDPAMVLADASQLHLIWVNLAVNAQDAMPQGGVLTIRVEPVDRTPTGPYCSSPATATTFLRKPACRTATPHEAVPTP